MDAVEGFVGVVAGVVSGGERVAGEEACLVGGVGSAGGVQGGEEQVVEDVSHDVGGLLNGLL